VAAVRAASVDPRVARTQATALGAAIELLAERGYSGFSVEGVVERTGVAKTTLYRHWPTRDDLLAAAIASSTVPGRSLTPDRSARICWIFSPAGSGPHAPRNGNAACPPWSRRPPTTPNWPR
jgi:hypothetical protein